MENSINQIDQLAQLLKGLLPMKAEDQKRLDEKLRLEFNYNSNHMEGNTLTYSETELLLIFDETKGNHTLREYDEMKAHDVALQLIKDWAKDKERVLNETDIKSLNKTILVKPFWKEAITSDGQNTRRLIKVGDYKEFPNSVRLANGGIFDYASPTDTPILMGELMQWDGAELKKRELHPVALAALLHYRLVFIHPFDDGNGRISRLLMNYVLLLHDLPLTVIKTTDYKSYLSALRQADSGDLGAFIEYIAKQEIRSIEMSIKAAKGESIEEVDDIDKEIALWKKNQTTSNADVISKSDDIIYNLYQSCLRSLFILLDEKVNHNFADLFTLIRHQAFTGNHGRSNAGIEYFDEEMKKFVESKSADPTAKFVGSYNVDFSKLSYNIYLEGYKKDHTNTFSFPIEVTIGLEEFFYLVKVQDKILAKKLYTEIINDIQKREIVNDIVKTIFSYIKQKADKTQDNDED